MTFNIVWIIYIILFFYIIYDFIPKKKFSSKEKFDLTSLVKSATTAVANVTAEAIKTATTTAPTQDYDDPCNSTNLLCKPVGVKEGSTKGCALICGGTPNPKDPADSTNLKCKVAPNYNKKLPCGDCMSFSNLSTDATPYCTKS